MYVIKIMKCEYYSWALTVKYRRFSAAKIIEIGFGSVRLG